MTIAIALPTPPPTAMLKGASNRLDVHSPHAKPHDSVLTVKTMSTAPSGSTVSFPSDYTNSSTHLYRCKLRPSSCWSLHLLTSARNTLELTEEGDEESETEALLASAWRYPMGTLRSEPVPGMPLHVEDIKTQTARGTYG